MTHRAHSRSEGGFTLLELMVAIGIMTFMMVVLWSTTTTTAEAKVQLEAVMERNHELRIGMDRMVRDFNHAYLSANEDQQMTERRTMFIGEDNGTVTELRFSSLVHRTWWANPNESEQTLVAYFAAQDREDSSKTNLVRRESRRLSNEPWKSEKGDVDVLIRDIESVRFEYFDWRDNEWKKRWNSTQADAERGRLPSRVKIVVEVKDRNGNDVQLTTQTKIPLQEELRFFAN